MTTVSSLLPHDRNMAVEIFRGPDHMAILVPVITHQDIALFTLASSALSRDTSLMATEPIQSRQNQWVKRVRKALDRHDEEIVLEGPKMIRDAIESGWQPLVILHDERQEPPHDGSQPMETSLFRELCATRSSQGVIALFPRRESSIEDVMAHPPHRIVALDSIQDPGNVGTIIRSAAAFGMTGVVALPGTSDAWGPKSIRASAGSVLSIPVARASIEELLGHVRDRNLEVYAADPRADSITISRADDFIVVFGSEGRGISAELAEVSRGIRIAMSSRIESLNVAAAAAIILSRLYDGGR